jgi:hypothetical protein
VQNRERLRPIQIELAMRGCAIAQVQIDETLIGYACVLRYRLEIADGLLIKTNRNLLLKLGCVRIFFCRSEVVFFAHVTPFRVRLGFLRTCFAGRDDSNDDAVTAITVTNQKQSQCATQTKENNAVFIVRVIRVVNQFGSLVDEN